MILRLLDAFTSAKSLRALFGAALFGSVSLLLWANAAGAAPSAASALYSADPMQAYRAALPLYQYDRTRPLSVERVGTETFPGCRMLRFSYLSADHQRVPALLFVPDSASDSHPVPCLVLLHGFGKNKESMAALARNAALQGYASLAIDEYGQGQRVLPQTKGRLTPAVLERDLIVGVPQTVIDVRRGVDYLQSCPHIDGRRIGLLGVSLGAIMGAVAAGVEPRLQATVLISGGGDWALILKHLAAQVRTVGGHPVAAVQNVNWQLVSALLTPEDPLTFAGQIAPRVLLMVNGREDMTIVPQAAEELYRFASSPPGAHTSIVWLAHSGHKPAPELVYPVVRKWLAANL
jgi:dienelactone hydrolase